MKIIIYIIVTCVLLGLGISSVTLASVSIGTEAMVQLECDLNDSSNDLRLTNDVNVSLSGDLPSSWWKLGLTIDETKAMVLGESFVQLYLGDSDITIGRQRIAWGEADGVGPTDVINPLDYTKLFRDNNWIPVNALRLQHYIGDWIIDGVWVPTFTPATLNGLESFDVELPRSTLANAQFGFRVSRWFPGLDISGSYYNGYEPFPTLSVPTLTGRHYRHQMYGLDAAMDFGTFVLRTEGAYFKTEDVPLGRDDYVQYVIGIDWKRVEYYVNLQLMGEIDRDKNQTALGMAVEYELGAYKVLGATFYYGLREGDYMVNPEFRWDISDGVNLSFGSRFFGGAADTQMGQFADQDHAYISIKTSF